MKTLALSLVFTAVAAVSALADSVDIAASFAAATMSRGEVVAEFDLVDGASSKRTTYAFTVDRDLRVTALAINGKKIVGVTADSPLLGLPYPKKGRIENLELSLQAWDDGSASVTDGGTSNPGPGTVTPVIYQGDAVDRGPSGVAVVGENPGAAAGETLVSRPAGHGYAWHETLRRGDTVEIWFSAADLLRFMPVPEVVSPKGWSLDVTGGSASGPVKFGGQWGFWVYLDPSASNRSFWLRGPGGFIDWGSIDPTDPALGGNDLATTVRRDGGVEVIDLRPGNGEFRWWGRASGSIDGWIDAGSDWNQGYAHSGEAVAVRLGDGVGGINVFYAGSNASVIVRELDENGAVVRDAFGAPHEWLVSNQSPRPAWDAPTSVSAFVPIQTGRAVIIITPASQSASYGRYDVLVEHAGYAKG